MRRIFDLCQPRADVLAGRLKDEEFAADLSKVVNGNAVREYADPALFFHYTYPTRGLKALLETVCRRLSGQGGELNSVIRLDTQYGGGKTHSLIALVHAVKGMQRVDDVSEFIDPALLPKGNVRIAALSGENSAPSEGVRLEDGLLAYSLWGEMAYRLAGRAGFERIRKNDEKHIAPGAETIAEFFGDEPTLILIDEVSIYLRKAAIAFPSAADQFTAFLQALIKAVSSTPKAAFVCTLAIRAEDRKAKDAYSKEQLVAFKAFEEALSVAARQLLQLDPTEEDETVNVLQRRLFESVDLKNAEEIIASYADIWKHNKDSLSPDAMSVEIHDQFRKGYPLHPETLNVMTEKLSSLATFQRTRGMLRILTRTVQHLWDRQPEDAFAIHPHHIDPGYPPIRSEFTTKLGQGAYSAALGADIAAVEGKDMSVAQRLDKNRFPGQIPVVSYVARTIFVNTLAFGNAAQGISPEHLRYSVCSPSIEPALVEVAKKAFIEESMYLDDRPGAPLRFQVEPNLRQIVSRAMKEVNMDDLRKYLDVKIRDRFKGGKKDFETVLFPSAPGDISDEAGSGQPRLVVLHYDAYVLTESSPDELSPGLVTLATRKGMAEDLRVFQNNVVFVMADKKLGDAMKQAVRYRLALESVIEGPQMNDLADYQQKKVKEWYSASGISIAISIVQCYRHIFYPSNAPVGNGEAKLAHTVVELHNTSDDPGNGQQYIKRALRDQKKLLSFGDNPDSPAFVRDQTQLRTRGEISVAGLLHEYRKAHGLCILLDDSPLIDCIRQGIEQEIFIYREGEQLWGKGDPSPVVQISDNAFIHTIENAKKQGLWPRPEKIIDSPPPPSADSGSDKMKPVTDGDSQKKVHTFEADGPLRQALVQVFEDARSKNVTAFESLDVKFYEYKGAGMFQQAVSKYRGADVLCEINVDMTADGVESFQINFTGILQKANAIRMFVEQHIRASKENDFDAAYRLRFKTPLPAKGDEADSFIDIMTSKNGAESHVEAVSVSDGKKQR